MNAIEIPPPRPKKKPMHPYPRKMSQSFSIKMPVSEQPDWSSIPISSSFEQENSSPTSILNAFRSDTMGSSASNIPISCTSPISSTAESNQFGSLCGQENGCKLPNLSAEEESGCPSSISTDVTMRKESYMVPLEFNLGADKHAILEDAQPIEARGTSLKLFGRTVMVNDSQKPFSPSDGSLSKCSKPSDMILDFQAQVQPILQSAAGGGFLLAQSKSQCSPWPAEVPQFLFCLPSHGDPVSAAIGVNMFPLPSYWAFCGGLQLPATSPRAVSSEENSCNSSAEATDEKGNHQVDSWGGSNNTSTGDVVDPQSVEYAARLAPSGLRQSANSTFKKKIGYRLDNHISTMLLKKGAERGLTAYDIGSILCRETVKKESKIEEIIREAQDDVLPATNESVFLESVFEIMDRHLDELTH